MEIGGNGVEKLKLFISTVLFFTFFSFASDKTEAESGLSIYINGEYQMYSDKAITHNGLILVPLREVFESLGAEVTWNEPAQSIDIVKDDTHISVQLGSNNVKINNQTKIVPSTLKVINGSTFVPLRFIRDTLGAEVLWAQANMRIDINYDEQSNIQSTLHFIDVGQGDSTFIQFANGKNMLIDTGTDAAGEKVVDYLKSLNVKTLDFVVATHPDVDHIGGMVDVLKAFKVETFIDSGKSHTTKTYEHMLIAIENERAEYVVPELGDYLVENAGLREYIQVVHINENAETNNDASIVLKGSFCGTQYMLMGDATKHVEKQMIETDDSLQSQILKIGHHGSYTSSSLEFLKVVNPESIILSYGEHNDYGHPHQVVLNNIAKINANTYSTATEGTIVLTIDCNGYFIDAKEFEFETVEQKPAENTGTYVIPEAPTSFANCEAMREYYPKGVQKGHPAYTIRQDRDNDGWACE